MSVSGIENLNSSELTAAQYALSRPAEEYGNDQNIEIHWAMRAYSQAEVHYNLISAVDSKLLKLLGKKMDDVVYKDFRSKFPSLKVDLLDEDALKSESSKAAWRDFCNSYKESIEDFNFATLLRLDSGKEYSEKNTTLVPRAQFLAIEIARNKEGFNDAVRTTIKSPNESTSAKT